MGMVDWRRGEIELNGRSILKTPAHKLARSGVVLIPQGDALFPGLSVKDNLDSGAFATGWRERKRRRERVLKLFPRLADRLGQAAGTLSGGERRMCSLGRGLMTDARVYLIDEPSLGLAPGIAAGLYSTLRELDLQGGTLLLAEQNQSLLEGWIDRIVKVHGGQIVGIIPGDGLADGWTAEGNGQDVVE
jgi:branched-chain amino acid transport system ATP-binding protein